MGDAEHPDYGAHLDVPWEEYFAWPDLHKSCMWTCYTVAPAKYKYEIDHPEERDSREMKRGRATHSAILEPDNFPQVYIPRAKTYPAKGRSKPFNMNATYCKEWVAEREDAGLVTLKRVDYEKALRMRDAVHKSRVCAELIAQGQYEVSMRWLDPTHDVDCKGRMDLLSRRAVVDLKTCQCANVNPFGYISNKYGYHFGGAFYLDGARQLLTREIEAFVLMAVEVDPPHLVLCHYLDEADALPIGRGQYKETLRLIKQCQESGVWPGYGDHIVPLMLPGYAGCELQG